MCLKSYSVGKMIRLPRKLNVVERLVNNEIYLYAIRWVREEEQVQALVLKKLSYKEWFFPAPYANTDRFNVFGAWLCTRKQEQIFYGKCPTS